MKKQMITLGLSLSSILYLAQNDTQWSLNGSGDVFNTSVTNKVGVGNTSPAYKLDIKLDSQFDGLRISNPSSTGNTGLFLGNSGVTPNQQWEIWSLANGHPWGGGNMLFFDGNNANPSPTMLFQRSTNHVGIGTINPFQSKLHVVKAANPAAYWQWGTKSEISQNTAVPQGASYLPFIGVGGYAITTFTNQSEMTGVEGTASYGFWSYGGKFKATGVFGTSNAFGIYAEATNGGTNNWAGYFSGSTYATGSYQSSDRKLKKEIIALSNSTEKLLQLNPKSYFFRIDEFKSMNLPTELQLGLIADELEKVFPELIKNVGEISNIDEKGNKIITSPEHKSINYIGLIPVLIAGFQEQQKQLEEQKTLIENLSKNGSKETGLNSNLGIDNLNYLGQNEPNPFTTETTIHYSIPSSTSNAVLNIYDLTGKQISSFEILEKGEASIVVNADKLAAGIYIYTIIADGTVLDSKRMIVSEK